jgi:hypothetical protein
MPNFFIEHLPILARCKTKGAVRAVGALLRNWQLGAKLTITVRDGAVTLEGSHLMQDGRIFLKTFAPLSLMMTYPMSLISAGSISLDSTFNFYSAGL